VVSRQNADIVDTLQLREVAMETTSWLPSGYNFGCVIASDMLFDSWGGFLGSSCLLVALYSFAVAAAGTAPGG